MLRPARIAALCSALLLLASEAVSLTLVAKGSRNPDVDAVLAWQHGLVVLTVLGSLLLLMVPDRQRVESGASAFRAYERAVSELGEKQTLQAQAFAEARSRLEESLRDRETMARAGELTAGIAHEVRNALATIGAQAALIKSSDGANVPSRAESIVEEVRHLEQVVDRFVEFIKAQEVRSDEFDLLRMVQSVVARERTRSPLTEVRVVGSSTLARGDEALLSRAVENVVRNALDAAGAHGTVEVSWSQSDAEASIVFDDTGPGIDDPTQALRPFKSARAGGLGLGLPLAVKILAAHGGRLMLLPNPSGRGTRATLRWPSQIVTKVHEPTPDLVVEISKEVDSKS